MKTCYVITDNSCREGEFRFCCSTQEHTIPTLKDARAELLGFISEEMNATDPPTTRKEVESEFGFKILKITVEQVCA